MNLTLSWSRGQNRASAVQLFCCTAAANQRSVSDCHDWGCPASQSLRWDTLSSDHGHGTVCPTGGPGDCPGFCLARVDGRATEMGYYCESVTQRNPTPPERSMLGDISSSLPCSFSLYACGKYQIEPCG